MRNHLFGNTIVPTSAERAANQRRSIDQSAPIERPISLPRRCSRRNEKTHERKSAIFVSLWCLFARNGRANASLAIIKAICAYLILTYISFSALTLRFTNRTVFALVYTQAPAFNRIAWTPRTLIMILSNFFLYIHITPVQL